VLQGKRYLRGWKIDSNLPFAVLNEHLPTATAVVHSRVIPHPSSPAHRYAGTSTITAVASFLLPAFHLRPSSFLYVA